MSTVDEWAKREAVGSIQSDMTDAERAFWIAGQVVNAKRMAALLLSTETWSFLPDWNDEEDESLTKAQATRLMRAALTKITEGKE